MELERDPNMRRRLDGQAMLDRDEQVTVLREQGVPFRVIAKRLGCSVGSVQKALRRQRTREVPPVDEFDEEPVWPLRSAGLDEDGYEWFVDAVGRRFDCLAAYRAQRYLAAAGRHPQR